MMNFGIMGFVWLVYIAFMLFFVWVMLRIVQSLGQIARAQSATVHTLTRIADGLERRP
jgi:hypothetical protein